MGSTRAQIYVGSPAAVAAAALEGKIADPTGYLGE
jgi:homoaconitase/3-isopropylmalate dehydratase large subunit